ncbi:MAG: hypothetical protein ABIG68_11855 [Acidobacteriota bacterium]
MTDLIEPARCHLWTKSPLRDEDLKSSLEKVKTYEDESHLKRALYRCRDCGQLYLFEFYEEVDWQGGDDPQWSAWIPVTGVEQADEFSKLAPGTLGGLPGIHVDFPRDADKPTEPYRIEKKKG